MNFKIYAVGWDDLGPVKIGYGKDVMARLKDLQVGNPNELKVFHELGNLTRDEAIWVEGAIHDLLEARRIRGEWFNVTVDEAKARIDGYMQDYAVRLLARLG